MSWSYRPALDGLRTVAVYSVLLFHTGHPWALGGFIGVDLFFVLSGFLVTSVILSEIDRTGRLRLGSFYARRVRRLLPAAVVAIIATSAVFVLVTSVVRRIDVIGDAQAALLYYANWHFVAQSGDYFATDVDKSPFLHFWSLAIEEQYYVVFPVLVLLLTRKGRRWLLPVLSLLLAASVAAQLYWAQVDATRAYYGTDARLYQLLAGSVLAVTIERLGARTRRIAWGPLSTVSLVAFLVLCSGLVDMSPSARGLVATVVALGMITGLMVADTSRISGLLSRRVPVFLGRISYGTYLWHWPVILVLEELLATSPRVVAVLTLALSTGLAAASYEVLEMPVRKSTHLDRLSWTPAVVGVAVSALIAVTLVPALLGSERKPVLAAVEDGNVADGVTGRAVKVPEDVDWEAVRNDRGREAWCSSDQPQECIVEQGRGTHVLLLGDSQAQSLVPMFERLAQEEDLTFSTNVVAGCPWQRSLTNLKLSDSGQERCAEARVDWFEEALPELAPDVVLIMSRPRDDASEWQGVLARRDGQKQPMDEMILDATRETLRQITKVVPRTLIVDRLVMPESFDPTDCLATTPDPADCSVGVPFGGSESDGYSQAAAAASPRIDTVDLNPAFCPGAPICRPVVGRQVVWRDDHHVTARFALARRGAVWKILQDTGAFD